ncbi:hypothetical protein [Nocardiopsis dassonvillei]|uniref:hypothetical protein n=1 Tax=Nocardiopsis dassonvillei TaxID=2014 RepID=UPI00157CDFEB|nr:hypothetical protein [Nocardiopsis dassonvillei]
MSNFQIPDETGGVPSGQTDADGHRATDMPSLGDPTRIVLPDPFADADATLLRQPPESDAQAAGVESADNQN